MAKWTYVIPIPLIFFRACKRIQKIQGFGERFIRTTPFLPGKVFTHFNWKDDLAIWLSGYLAIWLSGYRAIWLSGYRAIGLSGYLAACMAGRGYCKI